MNSAGGDLCGEVDEDHMLMVITKPRPKIIFRNRCERQYYGVEIAGLAGQVENRGVYALALAVAAGPLSRLPLLRLSSDAFIQSFMVFSMAQLHCVEVDAGATVRREPVRADYLATAFTM
jgi:hypothetical protein